MIARVEGYTLGEARNAHIAPLVRHEAYSNLIKTRLGLLEKRLDLAPDKA
jgi:hypothetical protein